MSQQVNANLENQKPEPARKEIISQDKEINSIEELLNNPVILDEEQLFYLDMDQSNFQKHITFQSMNLNSEKTQVNFNINSEIEYPSFYNIDYKNKHFKSKNYLDSIKRKNKIQNKFKRELIRTKKKYFVNIMDVKNRVIETRILISNIFTPILLDEVQSKYRKLETNQTDETGISNCYGEYLKNGHININTESFEAFLEDTLNKGFQEVLIESTNHQKINRLGIVNAQYNENISPQTRLRKVTVLNPVSINPISSLIIDPLMFGCKEPLEQSFSMSTLNQSGIIIRNQRIKYEVECSYSKYEMNDE